MKNTKKLTLSALLCALGVVFMALGSVIDVIDLTVCALVSLLVVFVYLELGTKYAIGVYICTSIAALIVVPSKLLCFEYILVFGFYPLLKALIERLPRWLWLIVKLAFINTIIWLLIVFVQMLFGFPFIEGDSFIFKAALYILMNFAFIVYDLFISVMVRVYYEKFRSRFKRFLK